MRDASSAHPLRARGAVPARLPRRLPGPSHACASPRRRARSSRRPSCSTCLARPSSRSTSVRRRRPARPAGPKAPENVLYAADWERLLSDRWLLVHLVRGGDPLPPAVPGAPVGPSALPGLGVEPGTLLSGGRAESIRSCAQDSCPDSSTGGDWTTPESAPAVAAAGRTMVSATIAPATGAERPLGFDILAYCKSFKRRLESQKLARLDCALPGASPPWRGSRQRLGGARDSWLLEREVHEAGELVEFPPV